VLFQTCCLVSKTERKKKIPFVVQILAYFIVQNNMSSLKSLLHVSHNPFYIQFSMLHKLTKLVKICLSYFIKDDPSPDEKPFVGVLSDEPLF
jgi:hypothetical protein